MVQLVGTPQGIELVMVQLKDTPIKVLETYLANAQVISFFNVI